MEIQTIPLISKFLNLLEIRLSHIHKEDFGYYECFGENALGTFSDFVYVDIEEAPEQVKSPEAPQQEPEKEEDHELDHDHELDQEHDHELDHDHKEGSNNFKLDRDIKLIN